MKIILQAAVVQFAVAACLLPPLIHAAAPNLISYQGKLTDASGVPLSGSHEVTFRLYTLAVGGSLYWTETQTVDVQDGMINVHLGIVTPLPTVFTQLETLFLSIQIDTDPELTPRRRLGSVPYALRVKTIDGAAGGTILGQTNIYSVDDNTYAFESIGGKIGGSFHSLSTLGFCAGVLGEYYGFSSGGMGVSGKAVVQDGYGIGGAFEGGYLGMSGDVYSPTGSPYDHTGTQGQVIGQGGTGKNIGLDGFGQGGMFNYGVMGYGANTSTPGATAYGVYGAFSLLDGAAGYAGYFNGWTTVNGYLQVLGNISKAAGSLTIDHPLDPGNKFLQHSFVESPDMMNIYNGNVVTDAQGYATVTMPDYFEALNRDFRYQLTAIGQFAQAIISQEIADRRFVIQTDKPNVKVSWQVTGIRHDAYANAHRIEVEVQKKRNEIGHYIDPAAFGLGPEKKLHFEQNKAVADRYSSPNRKGRNDPKDR